MTLKHQELAINPENPFENCKLERAPYAMILSNIVKTYPDGFVIAINNEWGTGKTTFVRMWEQDLLNQGFKTLYFNAWENDFEKDVLVSLISELKTLKESKTEELFKNVVKKAAPITKKLAVSAAKSLINKYVGHEFTKDVINSITENTVDGLEAELKSYTERKQSISSFKESLSSFVKKASDNKPVLFIIDELDRCRPNYAVEVLEQVKHLFSVSGITFVLSIDKEQLGNSVRGVYGSDRINADEYLRRFIDIEYSIPSPNTNLFCKYLYEYFQFDDFLWSEKRQSYPELLNDGDSLIRFSTVLFEKSNISLRMQEKIYSHARLALNSFNDDHYLIPEAFIFLIYIRMFHLDIYENIKRKRLSLQEFINKLEPVFPQNLSESDLRLFLYTEAVLLMSYNNYKEGHYSNLLTTNNSSELKLAVSSQLDKTKENAELINMIQSFNQGRSNIRSLSINHFISRIDLIEPLRKI